ncbi:tRNA (adenosine(37)-N6)-threonylcarbamoyltransferase complex dimerization subunit type 1 TsaB [Buchnera aphidicola]|uniref:tRNA (adenosine(37)-N6)-threonylcarbamoyltransferase complex dimerization subunit type 1 TsaB n=1 Tax=Buchnera aphidicola TaxID=9 RepID=UPI003BEF2A24
MSNLILAIDTSLDSCSVALYKKKIYSLFKICDKKHTIYILPMINKLLEKTETKFSQLSTIAVSRGPGNFTSIRIAVSIAQSLSLSFKIPLISISTLLLLSEQAWRKYQKNKILVAIQASQKKVYWAEYTRNIHSTWIGENTESCIDISLIKNKINIFKKKWVLVGNAWIKIKKKYLLNIENKKIVFPHAQDMIPVALLSIKNNQIFMPIDIKPNYLNNVFENKNI